jgi:hypothetical protein|tara:strand:+ start:641 stop:967 length:327 start_codon:yes stop_codon:yes gene_type:complete
MDGAMIPIIAVLGGMMIGGAGLFGWIHTTRLKIKHGYPLETMWGVPIHPSNSEESKERLKLLTQENAQLRAELGSIKDRLGNVERIVTDSGYSLTHEIESLRDRKDAH